MTYMNELEMLRSLGLKESEAIIYQTLLKSGPVSIRQIATAAKVNRGTTYENLKHLSTLGLVSFNRQGERRKFFTESPNKIHELIDKKRRDLNQTEAQAKTVVPALLAIAGRQAGEPMVRFYEDDEGIATILRDVITTVKQLESKQYYAYSSRLLRQYIYRRFPNFTRRRIKEGISVKVIAVGKGGEPTQQAERKWLPEPDRDRLSSYVLIYANKLA